MNPSDLQQSGLTIMIVAGLFSICGAAFDWDFFMNHRKARFFVNALGRTGARVFYSLFGVVIVVLALLMKFGVVPTERKRQNITHELRPWHSAVERPTAGRT